jgi:pSer/pThr/pTyr-binding forkhead associated (FHA) protein
MTDISQSRVIIRHLSGSKVNQVEQIPLKDLHEITIGRDVSSTVAYDTRRDDVVSRRHAVIRIEQGENPVFRLSDLGSSNGSARAARNSASTSSLVPPTWRCARASSMRSTRP